MLVLTLLACFATVLSSKTPIVLVHGILADANDDLTEASMWFLQNLDCPVYSIKIGKNDRLDSIFKPMSWQLERLREAIDWIGFEEPIHLVGFSQGGLLSRAFAETSDKKRVKTLMTFGTPHMGVYYYSDESMYSAQSQAHLSFSNYWKDPYLFPLYLKNSTFLPSLNGEIESGLNLNDKIDDFVMVWSQNDEIIRPIESGKYEFFDVNSEVIVPFEESKTYKDDYIGIRKMFEEDRIHFIETDCAHKEYKSVTCLEKYKKEILKYFK